jgi:hypothetical protein
MLSTQALKTAAGEAVAASTVTIAAADAGMRYFVAWAHVAKAGTGQARMKFGTRAILSTTSDATLLHAEGGPYISDVNEALAVEIDGTATGNYAVTWGKVPA